MQLFQSIDKIRRIDEHIRRKGTGNPEEFANLLSLSVATLYRNLNNLRSLGAEISYSRERKTFYYQNNFQLKL